MAEEVEEEVRNPIGTCDLHNKEIGNKQKCSRLSGGSEWVEFIDKCQLAAVKEQVHSLA